MTQPDVTVRDGWLRFWRTFGLPWKVVVGFGLACIVSEQLAEALWWIVRAAVRSLR